MIVHMNVHIKVYSHGFERALTEAGIPIEPKYSAYGDWTYRSGYDLGLHLLTLHPRPTAIFALNELMLYFFMT